MSKITLAFMQRFMGKLDTAIRNYVSSKLQNIDSVIEQIIDNKLDDAVEDISENVGELIAQKQDKPIIMHQTLSAGDTTITFTDVPITGFNMIDIYTSVIDFDYNELSEAEGQLTVVYDAQESDVEVYLRIEVVPNESV